MKIKSLVAFIVILFLFSCATKPKEEASETTQPVYNDLPTMPVTLTDGSQVVMREQPGNTIIILFFPDCDHCQREAKSIQEKLAAFKKYTLYFISSSPMEEIEKFAVDYKLSNEPGVKFGFTETAMVVRNFGAVPTPSIYIYSSERRMVKKFEGETPIEEIIKFL